MHKERRRVALAQVNLGGSDVFDALDVLVVRDLAGLVCGLREERLQIDKRRPALFGELQGDVCSVYA